MGERHIKSAIQAITGGYMPPGEMMSLARRFRDIPIFPEKPKDWDKLPAKKHKERSLRTSNEVLYVSLLSSGKIAPPAVQSM